MCRQNERHAKEKVTRAKPAQKISFSLIYIRHTHTLLALGKEREASAVICPRSQQEKEKLTAVAPPTSLVARRNFPVDFLSYVVCHGTAFAGLPASNTYSSFSLSLRLRMCDFYILRVSSRCFLIIRPATSSIFKILECLEILFPFRKYP